MKRVRLQIQTKRYKNKCKLKPHYFTRTRKLGLESILSMIMNMMRKTLQIEIDEYINITSNRENMSYTKQAFSEARQKLSPDAFTILNDTVISEYYRDDDFKKYKGRRLLAADASILEIPNNKEARTIYGYAENGFGLKLARAMMSELYDLENGIIVSSQISHYTSSERSTVKENIEKMLGYKHNHINNLILFDRGYPSLELILYLKDKGIDFLMRTSNTYLTEFKDIQGNDNKISIEVNKERKKHLKKSGINLEKGHLINLRVIKLKLDSGEEETLITNLSGDELNLKEAKELYFRRWGIETKFNELKNKFQIENFSGEKPLIIEQDFYSSVLISNLATLIRNDAEEELIEKNKDKHLKHTYTINNNILIGKLKFNLILLLLEEDDSKQRQMYDVFLQERERNVVPIIKNRQFSRKRVIKSNKYSKNKRRCL